MTDSNKENPKDIHPALKPLFNEPDKWFRELLNIEAYENALGWVTTISKITPEEVTFGAGVVEEPWFINKLYGKYRANDSLHGVRFVVDEESAQNRDEICLWAEKKSDEELLIWERVPFENRVTTPTELQNEMRDILRAQPDWDRIISNASDYAQENTVSELTEEEFNTTYKVLETGRDNEENLTPDQKAILNEAHAIVQEMQSN
jgi:hypothetical protein